MKLELNHIATTTPSYFLGSSLPVVQVYVDELSTYREIRDELLEVYTYEHILPNEAEEEKVYIEAYIKAVEELSSKCPLSLDSTPKCVYGIGSIEDDSFESVCMYFTVEVVEGE